MKTYPTFRTFPVLLLIGGVLLHMARASGETPSTVIVDTGQDVCFDRKAPIGPPRPGQQYHGQDAQYAGVTPHYRDNEDGTVTDLNAGLTGKNARFIE